VRRKSPGGARACTQRAPPPLKAHHARLNQAAENRALVAPPFGLREAGSLEDNFKLDPGQDLPQMKDEDDDLRELNELLQQYAEATMEERTHLRPGVERAISKVLPSLLDTADTGFFNGDYLKNMFDQCMKRALARPDLSPDRKTNAREDWEDFMAFFNAAKQWQVPKLAAHAFEMTMLGIFAGLRAGLNPVEIDELREKFMSERQRKAAEKGVEDRRNKEWRNSRKTRPCACTALIPRSRSLISPKRS
jgi:hypothetical protein